MAVNTQPIFAKSPNNAEVTHVPADTTTKKDVCVAVTDGTKLLAINCTSDDTSTVEMEVYLYDGTTAYLLGTKDVPTLSGTDGVTPSVNLLDPTYITGLDDDGHLFIKSSYKVQVAPKATVTTAKTVTCVGFAVDYTA